MMIAWIYLDKRNAAIDALKDYRSMEFIINDYADNLATAEAKLQSVPSAVISDMPKNRGNPKAGEARLAAAIDEIDVLKERYRRALEYMEWFVPAWNALNEDERFVLTEFYLSEDLQTKSVLTICHTFHIEKSAAYKRKDVALTRLALLLYGK